ncbi:hypothetical protein [Mesorhizobium silamurunense]|uniref:hypothetical protein n=1 Tax=Mesorhizobium silamurunense TaxID=499528 RepID=UPI001781F022|nr:hypothetical protein [Mesorhizobium silamurunense]
MDTRSSTAGSRVALVEPRSPVSSMRSFSGLMAAYWLSKKWLEAWGLTSVIIVLTALSALASVWFAEVSGQVLSSIALLHRPKDSATLRTILQSVAILAAIVALRDVAFIPVRHYFSTTLHRKWRAWLDERSTIHYSTQPYALITSKMARPMPYAQYLAPPIILISVSKNRSMEWPAVRG